MASKTAEAINAEGDVIDAIEKFSLSSTNSGKDVCLTRVVQEDAEAQHAAKEATLARKRRREEVPRGLLRRFRDAALCRKNAKTKKTTERGEQKPRKCALRCRICLWRQSTAPCRCSRHRSAAATDFVLISLSVVLYIF